MNQHTIAATRRAHTHTLTLCLGPVGAACRGDQSTIAATRRDHTQTLTLCLWEL